MRVSDFDYQLPPENIAQHPADRREASRLLELSRATGRTTHRHFPEIIDLLSVGDVMVLNDTRVIPARLVGVSDSGARAELLLLEPVGPSQWRALGRPGRLLSTGRVLHFGDGRLSATVEGHEAEGVRVVRLAHSGELLPLLDEIGLPPLPPYVRHAAGENDRERYQTVYAARPGAVAAPTAGLHFTEELLRQIRARGVTIAAITLHVGMGTFLPVRTETVEEHRMHEERYDVPAEVAELANSRTGRLVAVGTTAVRALETVADEDGRINPGAARTDLFITPGYRFKAVQAMLTNFHLPKSTLMMMVSAFAGRDTVMAAYREAIAQGYRFYSYGDAMFIH